MGGTWEHLIWTVRNSLEALLLGVGYQMDGKAFKTLMKEAECIVHSRPLTTNHLK